MDFIYQIIDLLFFRVVKWIVNQTVDLASSIVKKIFEFAAITIDGASLILKTIEKLGANNFNLYCYVAVLVVPPFHLYEAWHRCEGFWLCSWEVVKAFLWGLVWPAYVLARSLKLDLRVVPYIVDECFNATPYRIRLVACHHHPWNVLTAHARQAELGR